MGEAWLLDWEDPEIRVEEFFLNVERDINRLFSKSLTKDEALFKYVRSFRRTSTSDDSVSSDSNCDCNSWEDFSEVDSLSEEDSVGNTYAEELRAESLCSAELWSQSEGDVMAEISTVDKDSCNTQQM